MTIEMLKAIPFPAHIKNVVEYAGGHHEHMDGTGFPNRLKRFQMSVPARILGLADVFEALSSSDRPYKKSKSCRKSSPLCLVWQRAAILIPICLICS